ncbi:putative peptidoglycan binding protein [Actinocorallia herbida]|uniref:Putative peptidoglycan binding protein n=1 Tax=Actinocorallia herbida TaxID=58109 RepID=A0A3N1D1A9_9ACTN|nr:peptidoglycan-binding protein [Actinocorallia herbida]ROO86848.1 putative peptidoglycan binding protein [Actinocorallia herbida]
MKIKSIVLSVAAGVVIGAVAAPLLEDGPATPSAPGTSSTDLRECPDLRRGTADPVDGKDCVRALQGALHALGYAQPVTGGFRETTEQNVLAFQRAQGIEPNSGVAGPKTRAALADAGTVPAAIGEADYSLVTCGGTSCHLYLRRSTTKTVADFVDAHPAAVSIGSGLLTQGACRVLKMRKAGIVCDLLAGGGADHLLARLDRAAERGACLHLRIGLPSGEARLVSATAENGARCAD